MEKKFRPEIEGLRFVAALLVAIYHIWLGRVSGGVDVFFIISGYLITASIISKINKDGFLSFSKFFGGLLKRLLPNATIVLLVVGVATFFLVPGSLVVKTVKELLASLFYYQNLQLAFSNTDYLNSEQAKTPVEHFWAMSIQGQFYLMWFLIFTVIVLFWRRQKSLNIHTILNFVFASIFLVSLAYSVYATNDNQAFAYFNPLARAWQFALGGLVYLNLHKLTVPKLLSNLLGWFGLIGLLVTGLVFDVSTMFPGYIALWPMACAVLILLSGNQPSSYGVEGLLSRPLLMKLGGISFGIYLWHWVILSFYNYNVYADMTHVTGVLIIVISIILSLLSTKIIETPLRMKTGKNALISIGLLFVLTFGVIGLLAVDHKVNGQNIDETVIPSQVYPGASADPTFVSEEEPVPSIENVKSDMSDAYGDGVMIFDGADLKPKAYGQIEDFDYHILLVGGSHSSHWLGALQQIAETEKIKITHLGKANARFTMGEQEDHVSMDWMNNVNNYLEENSEEFDLLFTTADVGSPEEPEIPEGFINEFEFVQNLGLQVFAVRDNPRLTVNAIEAYERDTSAHYDVSQHLPERNWDVVTDTGAVVYDYSENIAPGKMFSPVRGNVFVYFDSSHMTNSFSRTLGPVIKDDLMKELEKVKSE